MAFGLYLHIPYCLAKCYYCDFYSRGKTQQVPEEYIDSLVARMEQFRQQGVLPAHPDTVYLGGGTPSLLTPAQLERLLSAANPAAGAEITLEANPETLSPALLEGFLKAGANRLSLGIQTAYQESLTRIGRPHTVEQSRLAFSWARQAGFENISGDIMMALPHYTTQEFDRTLDLMLEGGATHISAYLLKLEPDTRFGKHPPEGLPNEEQAADFYLYGVEQLEQAGFAQYEISSFAKPGFQGRHNLLYWNCEDYLGLGPAAHSCVDSKRFYWPSNTSQFLQPDCQPVMDGDCDGVDFLLMQLRLSTGLHLPTLRHRYGMELTPSQMRFLQRCAQQGYVQLENDTVQLTPSGMLIQNSILVELLQ